VPPPAATRLEENVLTESAVLHSNIVTGKENCVRRRKKKAVNHREGKNAKAQYPESTLFWVKCQKIRTRSELSFGHSEGEREKRVARGALEALIQSYKHISQEKVPFFPGEELRSPSN